MNTLLSREQFREQCLARDKGCIVPWCSRTTDLDAHHIISRKAWSDESYGYYLSNGASLCAEHHVHAERGIIPPQALWRWLGVSLDNAPTLTTFKDIDCDGEPITHTVALLGSATSASTDAKYPSTLYLPFSAGQNDECVDLEDFLGVPLQVSVKMDGSNVKLVGGPNGYVASRAAHPGSATHESFSLLKQRFAQEYKYKIPEGLVVFGEWLYAEHSIHYTDLEDYLQIFAVYDPSYRLFLSYREVIDLCNQVGFRMPYDFGAMVVEVSTPWELTTSLLKLGEQAVASGHEGIVVRSIYPFHYSQFGRRVAKYVRENHVQTDIHWSKGPIVRNEVRV